jgi:biotin carboxyl carrier protein
MMRAASGPGAGGAWRARPAWSCPFPRSGPSLLCSPAAGGRSRGAETAEEEAVATPVEAPMVGKILQVLVKVGDQVAEDDTVVVMEAMKMEINVVAPTDGRIAVVHVAPGDSVDTDQVLATIE